MGRRGRAWGFKGEGQGLGVRPQDGELAGDLSVTGERGTQGTGMTSGAGVSATQSGRARDTAVG